MPTPTIRDMMTIVENAEADAYCFHGTNAEYLPSIAADGLTPTTPGPPYNCWPEYDYIWEDAPDDEDVELPPEASAPRVFATESFSDAKEYADNNADPAVIRIAMDVADWDDGETDHPYLYSTKPVPPEMIAVWTGQGWMPIREFVAGTSLRKSPG